MALTNVTVRMDEDLKRKWDSVCDELGMTMSTAVNLLARTMTREKRLPFTLELNPDPFFASESNMRFMLRGLEALNAGKGVEHEIDLEDCDE